MIVFVKRHHHHNFFTSLKMVSLFEYNYNVLEAYVIFEIRALPLVASVAYFSPPCINGTFLFFACHNFWLKTVHFQ